MLLERNYMMREILNIDPKKATTGNSIPSKTLKLSADIYSDVLQNLFVDMLSTSNFPDNIKLADITPVFKKKDPLKVTLYKTITSQNVLCETQIKNFLFRCRVMFRCQYIQVFAF